MNTNHNLQLLSAKLPFWSHLSAPEQQFLSQSISLCDYKKNQTIHTAEFECIGLLLVKSGMIRIFLISEEGKEVTLYRISEGEVCVLSAACVLPSITFDIHIEAVSDTRLLQISAPAFSRLMKENIYVEAFAYKTASLRFSDVMWTMQQILFMRFDQRLAVFLLEESAARETDVLKITHEQIAKLVGSAREVVTRMLNYFAEEGWVTLSRGKIAVKDRDALKSLLQHSLPQQR